MIEPRADAYGREADASALADYLELLALADAPLARAELADLIRDNEWRVRSRELFHTPLPPPIPGEERADDEEPDEDRVAADLLPDPSAEAAGRVFDTLAERVTALGDLYPFLIDEPRLTLAGDIEVRHYAYLSLLAITVAHAYEVVGGRVAEDAFEELVATVMSARGLETVNVAAAAREGGDFRDVVRRAGEAVRLQPTPEAVISREHANDEGVDTLSHLWWGDGRAGHWVFIGQATCGKSESWTRKIAEPKAPLWGHLLNSLIAPIGYLAVPHHVDALHMQHLTTGAARLVLDRLRLCRYLPEVGPAQEALVTTVRAEPVWHPDSDR